MTEPTHSALIVPVPEAEDAVGRFRASLDPTTSWGVPAHITVLYPFLPPQRVDDEVLGALRDAVAEVPRFDAALTHVGWFTRRVIWLAPQPDRPFRDLTAAVWRRFPEAPPYEGLYDDVVPHLTIGHDAAPRELEDAATAVAAYLPITISVGAVRLMTGTPDHGPWRTACEMPLGVPVQDPQPVAPPGGGSSPAPGSLDGAH